MPVSKSIVFIHGLFQNPYSWTEWETYFEEKGYTCHAPAYPYHDGVPSDLRKTPDSKLGALAFRQVVDSLSNYIDGLPEKPFLIGHSMGGLAVQKLIAINKGIAGVCIDTAPPKGIFTLSWSFLKANLPTISPLKGDSVCLPDIKWFQYAFCNTMSLQETAFEYDKFVVPESRNIPRSTAGKDGYIDFRKPHNPLLFIAGEKDHIVPSSLNKKNYYAYKDKNSIADFKEFSGRTHYICGQKNWQEVAAFIYNWLNKL